jgi:hypothetical protein
MSIKSAACARNARTQPSELEDHSMKNACQLITKEVAQKVLATVDAGLSNGLGKPVPGEMCVEAAVCFALGLPHSDDPGCVAQSVRTLKIGLNDRPWSSPQARAKGLRRLALAQLGSKGMNEVKFMRLVADMTVRKVVPQALRAAITCLGAFPRHVEALEAAAVKCAVEGTSDAASYAASAASDASYAASYAASAASYAASAASYDNGLAAFAEEVVQILIAMNAPGAQWLSLT